jgi:AcrR family transcriptional regulator
MLKTSERDGNETAAQSRTAQGIVDAARRLFARYGYRRTSMNDIAREAGLAKTTLYLHYKGKDDILRAVQAHVMHQMHERCERAFGLDMPFCDKLLAVMEARFGPTVEDHYSQLYTEMFAVWTEVGGSLWYEDRRNFLQALARMLADFERAGEIDLTRIGRDAEAVARVLIRAVHGARLDSTVTTLEQFEDHLRSIVLLVARGLERR